MSDFDEIPVESVGGSRPGTATADRLIVGLAVLALLGGMLIAAGNVFGPLLVDDSGARSAAPSADASGVAGGTPRPSRTERPLREVSVIPGEPPAVPTDGPLVAHWVEALSELAVRSQPSETASVIDRLEPGQVVLAEPMPEDEDWFAIFAGAEGGFLRVAAGATPLVRTRPFAQEHFSGGITDIAAGPSGFVAHGWRPSRGYEPPGGMTLHSTDGELWIADDPSVHADWGGWAAAWGPSGWLAVASRNDEGVVYPWVWESPDGVGWTPIGRLPAAGEGFVSGLVANDDGYLLALGSPRVEQGVLWYSPDGLTWSESAATGLTAASGDPYAGPGNVGLLAAPDGFLTWIAADVAGGPAEVAFSRTGRSWQAVPLGTGVIRVLEMAVVNGRVLAVGLDDAGRTATWAGAITADGLEMSPTPSRALAFDGAVVTAVASDGARAYAFGHERDGTAARAWWSDGSAWHVLPIPDGGFGRVPRVAAAGPRGVVVAGARHGAVASSPVLWHLGDDDRWVPEATPAIPGIPDPRPAECPARPATAFEFLTVDTGVAVACWGDAPLTVVAWSAPCLQCWGDGRPSPGSSADWLRGAGPFLLLLPWEGDDEGGWWRQAPIHPDLTWRRAWTDTWLRVTGRYDDPAAAGCGTDVEVGAEWWWEGPEADVLACRRTYVVTAVEVLGRSRG